MDQRERSSIRERFLKVDTSNVADVLDEMTLYNQGLSSAFVPYPMNGEKLAGFAYTIQGQMAPFSMGGDSMKMEACHGLSANDVSVWAGDGEGVCYFGELIAVGMKERGCVGALADGGVRDVDWFGYHKFPVFARYRSPVQSIGRWKVDACQTSVFIRGATSKYVRVEPGDFVLADFDGAIVIPQSVIAEVLERSEALTRKETEIRAELAAGMTLAVALEKYGHV